VGELDGMLKASGTSLDRVIELTVDTDVVVGRLVKRAAEQGRADDTEDVIRRRLEVYAEQTAPLIAVYDARGLVARVDGMGDVADVTSRMLAAIGVDG
jgi:adenylate kinase